MKHWLITSVIALETLPALNNRYFSIVLQIHNRLTASLMPHSPSSLFSSYTYQSRVKALQFIDSSVFRSSHFHSAIHTNLWHSLPKSRSPISLLSPFFSLSSFSRPKTVKRSCTALLPFERWPFSFPFLSLPFPSFPFRPLILKDISQDTTPSSFLFLFLQLRPPNSDFPSPPFLSQRGHDWRQANRA